MTSLMNYQKITAKLVAGRLSFFVMNTDDKTDDRKDDRAELEEHFPSHVHWHHLPLCEEGKQEKIYTSSEPGKSTATVWHSYGCICTAHILPQVACFVK